MNKYTIYCTTEQVHKALELGAPIETYKPIIIDSKAGGSFTTPTMEVVTAEQMIGWIEEQLDLDISVERCINKRWSYWIGSEQGSKNNKYIDFDSRKEATLAAIDAALEYLIAEKQ